MKTVSLISGAIVLCLLHSCCVLGASNDANATLNTVEPYIGDKYIQALWDSDAPSGFVIKFDNPLNASFFRQYVLVYMYTRENSTSDRKDFFNSHVCDLLDPNNDRYPKDNYLPRDIIHFMFSDWYGSCEIESGRKPVGLGGPVSVDLKNNPDLQFPEANPFNLLVYILPNEEFFTDKPWDRYVIGALYDIEKLPEENVPEGESGYYCLNIQWNYYVIWRICTIFEFIESNIAGVGRKALHIF